MKCESCNINEINIEMRNNEGLEGGLWDTYATAKPYRLCFGCRERLKNMALRPLEYFNLTAIHGNSQYLHDDFYDSETGEATQPGIEVIDAEKFPFPAFEDIKNNLKRLVDYSFVQYFTDDLVLDEFRKFEKEEVLKEVDKRVRYNPSINFKAYGIVANVVGSLAGDWAKEQWRDRNQEDGILVFAELIANCIDFEEAFEIVRLEIEKSDGKVFADNASALLYFRSNRSLDWIEGQVEKIINVAPGWGQLAAGSQFSWQKCVLWLRRGRPLSLIALDALYLCTMRNYAGQSRWISKNKPKLTDDVASAEMVRQLQDYLATDNVSRTRNSVGMIIQALLTE